MQQLSTVGAYRTAAVSGVMLGARGFPLYLHPPPWALPLYVLGLAIVAWALSADDEVLRRTGLLAGLALVASGAVSALVGGVATYLLP